MILKGTEIYCDVEALTLGMCDHWDTFCSAGKHGLVLSVEQR